MASNEAVCREYASNAMQAKADSATMRCEYGTMYSYSTVIASFVEDPDKQLHCVIAENKGWSTTTRKQLTLLLRIIEQQSHRVIITGRQILPQMKWDELKEREIV